jgi:hypothetical protein
MKATPLPKWEEIVKKEDEEEKEPAKKVTKFTKPEGKVVYEL